MNDRSIENLEADLEVAWQDLQEMEADIAGGMDVPESQIERLRASVKQIERKIKDAKNDPT